MIRPYCRTICWLCSSGIELNNFSRVQRRICYHCKYFLKRIKLYSSNTSNNCFICAFGQPDGKLFVQKIWSTNSYFSPKIGPEVQATLSLNLKMWKKSSFFIYSENTNSNLCCPFLRSFWQRRVQHKLEFRHDEYTFVTDSGHFLFRFANRLFHAPI